LLKEAAVEFVEAQEQRARDCIIVHYPQECLAIDMREFLAWEQ